MAFITIEDLYGTAEILAFENTYMKSQSSLMEENIVLVKGRLSIREDDDVKIVAREIKELSQVENKTKTLRIDITDLNEEEKKKLRGAIKFFNGEVNNTPVQVVYGENILNCGSIYLNKDILDEFKELVSEEKVELV